MIMDSGGILGPVWIGWAVGWFHCWEEQRRLAFIVKPDKIKLTQKDDQTKQDSAWWGEKWWHRWLLWGVNRVLTLTGTLLILPCRNSQKPYPPLQHHNCLVSWRDDHEILISLTSALVDIAAQWHSCCSTISGSQALSVCKRMNQLVLFHFLQNLISVFDICMCIYIERER